MTALLSTTEAARLLGVTDSRVRALIRSGELAATRVGARSWAIDPADLGELKRRPPGRPRKKAPVP